MARPSKTPPFQIYEDTTPAKRASASDRTSHLSQTSGEPKEQEGDEQSSSFEAELSSSDDSRETEPGVRLPDNHLESNDDRRESTLTATTISSLPDSIYQNDFDNTHDSSTPHITRAPFRRPESARRMQMTSPPPFRSRNLRTTQSGGATPRSMRSSRARGDIRPFRYRSDDSDEWETEDESKYYPLVLLHITLLPVSLPWSMAVMRTVLSPQILENLHVLRSKVSETVVSRGILIPHPCHEYELLEERLLEALELKTERVSKCGHFRNRESTDTTITSSSDSSAISRDSDSGLGSSSSEADPCLTCGNQIKRSPTAAGEGKMKWSIRVFAANGLMRPPTWSAAWREMESVDVEILPWITDQEKRELDTRREEEEAAESLRLEDEEQRIRQVVEDQVMAMLEEQNRLQGHRAAASETFEPSRKTNGRKARDTKSSENLSSPDLPAVYQTLQIPISVLLKNYIYLLLQDRQKVAILFLALFGIFFAIRVTSVYSGTITAPELQASPASISLGGTEGLIGNVQNVSEQTLPPAQVMDTTHHDIDETGYSSTTADVFSAFEEDMKQNMIPKDLNSAFAADESTSNEPDDITDQGQALHGANGLDDSDGTT